MNSIHKKMIGQRKSGWFSLDFSILAFRRWLIFAALLFSMAVVVLPVQAQTSQLDELVVRYNAASVKADYLIAIDVSGSMNETLEGSGTSRFDAVKEAAVHFIEQVDAGEYVSIIGFGTYAYDLVVPREMPSRASDREAFLQEIRNIPAPSSATTPAFAHTDIGLALEHIIDSLNRPGHSDIRFAYFLTDGKHEPGPGTRYPTTAGPEWDQLTELAAKRFGNQIPRVFALELNNKTDSMLVRNVFPYALITPYSPTALQNFFLRSKQEVLRSKVSLLISQQLHQGFPAQVAGPGTVTLRPGVQERVPVNIDLANTIYDANWAITSVHSDLPAGFVIGSQHASGTIDQKHRTMATQITLTAPGKHNFFSALLGKGKHDAYHGKVELALTVSPTPQALMREMDIPVDINSTVTVPLENISTADSVLPVEWVLLSIILLLLAWGIFRTIAWSRADRLRGQLTTIRVPWGMDLPSWQLSTLGKEANLGNNPPPPNCIIPGAQYANECTIRAVRPSLVIALCTPKPLRATLVIAGGTDCSGTVRRADQDISFINRTEPLQDGDLLIFGEYELRWTS
ncbi:MAG: vWA domain-containing protein [bacterium]